MVQKIVKNEKNEFVWVITKLTYRRNVDWIYFEEYRKDACDNEASRECTILDRQEYTALFDFINNYCPFWESPDGDEQFGEIMEEE